VEERGKIPLIAIVGPTATGKSRLGILLAEKIGGEIVSADSMQVYRFMDIGTAKPSREERERVRHHFIDIIDPDEYYSAGLYSQQSEEVIKDIWERGRFPILVGGSGLYVRAAIDGLFPDEGAGSNPVRAELKRRLEREGPEKLYEELVAVDPETAQRLSPKDGLRVCRALEVFHRTGKPISWWQKEMRVNKPYRVFMFGLWMDRKLLYERINERVDEFIRKGLVEEVENLMERGYSKELPSMQGLGYKEIIGYLEGLYPLDEAIRLIKRNTRRFAKRQFTWFKRDERITWFDVGKIPLEEVGALIQNKLATGGIVR